jgi:hypothetical protein
MKGLFASIVAVLASAGCSALPAGQGPGVLHVTVEPTAVAVRGFLGFGAEWDPYSLNERTGPSRDDWDRTCRRIEWMRPPIVRMMMQAKWCMTAKGRFDPDTAAMRNLYRHLDLCQRLGVTVVLTDWGVEPDWLRPPPFNRVEDPRYTQVIVAYLKHLLEVKKYDCISYFVLGNEPDLEVRDFDRWAKGLRQLAAALVEAGLDKRITLLGCDATGVGEATGWHTRSVDELHDALGGYDMHYYVPDRVLRAGGLARHFARLWTYADAHDPAGAAKRKIVAEAGMGDDARPPRGNDRIGTYWYGLAMADYAVQAVCGGSDAVIAWMLEDSSHKGFFWGMWSGADGQFVLRPWFYSWSLLTRCFPAGTTLYRPAPADPDLRVLAGKLPAAPETGRRDRPTDWSFCLVNRSDRSITVRLSVPGGSKLELSRYLYSDAERPADKEGLPLPAGRAAADLGRGLTVACPAQSVVLLTSRP